VIVALGGGVAGDLVGFAAATVLRGVGLVQVPSSLLAMVDSSVGGKTGINHATGKNLIGAFYQPPVVLIDPDLLDTLPDREYRSGWAEIVKHGLIEPSTPAGDSGLFELLAQNAVSLAARRSLLIPTIITRNVEIKASVVRADERESGLRAILNFGHTIGHAVEAAGYQLLHGEAVAVGLHGAMRLGEALGRVPRERVEEVVDVLHRFGLPTEVVADVGRVRQLMLSDKKRLAGEQQWIVPVADGGASIERGIPEDAVDSAIAAVVRG
jgi:3-dehydroquinate synthetase